MQQISLDDEGAWHDADRGWQKSYGFCIGNLTTIDISFLAEDALFLPLTARIKFCTAEGAATTRLLLLVLSPLVCCCCC